ncbi:MAG: PD-(D/E)XK nuclease family protein, partial [Actinobacteria bacterium]|nr:PD-(D/E)XK nuclease family protein [Actinomycetota bacterium]
TFTMPDDVTATCSVTRDGQVVDQQGPCDGRYDLNLGGNDPAGVYTLKVFFTDSAGNVSLTTSGTYTLRDLALAGGLAAGLGNSLTLFLNVEPDTPAVVPEEHLERVEAATSGLRIVLEVTERAVVQHPAELLRLVDELEALRVSPQRLTQALRAWADDDAGRRAYGDEVSGLYSAYRRRLERLDRMDAPLYEAGALDALRDDLAAWGGTPVFFYGFDDLQPLQHDAVETLSATGAEVTVSLPYEPGRMAFAGRATAFADLYREGVEHQVLAARAEHYAPVARVALHHLERRIFELEEGQLFDPEPVEAGDVITLLQGGGERAELELVAAEAARLIRQEGIAPEEIAVVLRSPDEHAALLAEIFGAFGVPVALDRRVALGHTPLGRGLVGLLRCALPGGSADDLLAYLRTPGLLQRPELADRLETRARQEGARSAEAARALWEQERWTLEAIDRVRTAQTRGGGALAERLAAELDTLFAAPRRRAARVLRGAEQQDVAVLRAGRMALEQIVALARADRSLAPPADALAALLHDLDVFVGTHPGPGRVTVAEPLALRARRVRILFACGLQEGVFPAAPRTEPFFGDVEREQIAEASGLRLRRRDDLGAERYLFYSAVSRPEERLYLSWHEAGDDGDLRVRSFFVSDVCDLFSPRLEANRRIRSLGAVGWPEGAAPTERERLRGEASDGPPRREAPLASLRDEQLVAALRERSAWSASGIELWASCPVRWFVERMLDPEGLAPDPEAMLRGALTHTVLEAIMRGLIDATGSGRLNAATLPQARALAAAAIDGFEGTDAMTMSRDPSRQRAMEHRLRCDVLRYLEHAAEEECGLVPAELEVTFGGPDDEQPALDLPGGVRLRGRIDRIDTNAGGQALVYDYKGRVAVESAHWRTKRKYQVALYLLAARDVLGLDPVGGLYQPIGGRDARARGLVLEDAEPGLRTVRTDRHPRDRFDAIVDGVLEDVLGAVAEVRAGALEPRPASCTYNDKGCAYPTICRCEA